MKILTAIGNPILKRKLEEKGYHIINEDIQYKEGIIEYLEYDLPDCIILYENLEGEISIKKLIYQIKKQIKNIIIILEEDRLIPFLEKEKIWYIYKKSNVELEEIIYYIRKIKIIQKYKGIEKNKKYKKRKIKNKNRKKLIKKQKLGKGKQRYKKIKNKKIILIINLEKIKNRKIEKLIKNKLTLKIFIKKIEEKIMLRINKKEIILNNKNEILKNIFYLKLKNNKNKIVFIFIENLETINQENYFNYINKIILVTKGKLEQVKQINRIMAYNRWDGKSVKILLINNGWNGIDKNILENIFLKKRMIKEIKEDEKWN